MDMTHAPQVAVITNVTPNHLDWHRGMGEYESAKYNLLQRQTADNIAVLNYDDMTTRAFGDRCPASVRYFSLNAQTCGYGFDGESICFDGKPIISASRLRIPGRHNIANYMAAIAATAHEVSAESVAKVADNFTGVEHRIEFIRELDGVKYYNDSIASSPTRAIAGLMCFDCPVVLIAGGYDKKIAFDGFGELVCERVDTLMLCGATADKIEAAVLQAKSPNKPEIHRFSDLKTTVEACRRLAHPGSVVLFSPACASFDQFPNFMERGRFFKQTVNELI
jgi:UDP-N-acetylmuramoylalanine--D-glutamate ligase